MKKTKDLLAIGGIYLLAYLVGGLCGFRISDTLLRYFVFDSAATVAVFAFSVLLKNSSVYDAYWSLTPMVMAIVLFIEKKAFSPFQLVILAVFLIWSLRLTVNWITVFTDFSYEDWRYRQYRENTPKPFWQIVNFFGIHYMPTFLVFLGMTPLFVIATTGIGAFSLIGAAVTLTGVGFEFFADRAMHAHLREDREKAVCRKGLWRFSRHPNYLGEITVWLGVYLSMLPYAPAYFYTGIGFVGIAVLFNVVSIPLMEKRQLARRKDYEEYRKTTSRLLLLPPRATPALRANDVFRSCGT